MAGSVQLANGARCICGNSDALKFRRYYDHEHDDELLGSLCLECLCEYLKDDFFVNEDKGHLLKLGKKSFFLGDRSETSEDGVHMVHSAKTEIQNLSLFGDYLKPGDHIAWYRPYIIWHHAFVTDINTGQGEVRVIHWHGKPKTDSTIKEEWIDLKKQKGSLYRMDYQEEILKENPVVLAIARARSRLGDKGYNFFGDNCEAFVTYCKKGVAKSQQVCWLWREIGNRVKVGLGTCATHLTNGGCKIIKTAFLQGAQKVVPAEALEAVANNCQWVGLGLVVIIEGALTIYDITKLYEARKEGRQSQKEFTEQVTKRVTDTILAGGLAALGGLVPGVGIFIGIAGGAVGKLVGSWIGPHIGRAITHFIKTDDKAVSKIQDLYTGDQVVFYGNFLHPRHHCIVLWYDETRNRVNVVHSTYEHGVVQEWMDFVQPVYRVIYHETECYAPEEVCSRAISKLGQCEYNLLMKNCKHFAEWCKKL